MSTHPFTNTLAAGVHEVRKSSGWFLFLGIALIVLGMLCVAADVTATFATILAFGWLLLFSGVVALVQAFRVRTWNGFFLYLLSALLRGFTGYFLVRYPGSGAFAITLVLASFFIVGGLFRAIGAGTLHFPRWGWSVFSGIVSVILGVMLLARLPVSSLWFIGFAVGVDMILEGASLVSFAAAMRKLPNVLPFHEEDRAA
jgi:uncharacterized membrane protein HdeD (DUF308 family)